MYKQRIPGDVRHSYSQVVKGSEVVKYPLRQGGQSVGVQLPFRCRTNMVGKEETTSANLLLLMPYHGQNKRGDTQMTVEHQAYAKR